MSKDQEGGGVFRQIRGLVITNSATSRNTSVIFHIAAIFFGGGGVGGFCVK